MTITLEFSNRLDGHDLSDCTVLYMALTMYKHSLKRDEDEDLDDPAYFQRANWIVDDLMHQLTEALIGINQSKGHVNQDLSNILSYADPRKGGHQL